MLSRFALAVIAGVFLLPVSVGAQDSLGGGEDRQDDRPDTGEVIVITIIRGSSNTFPESRLPGTRLPQSQLMTTQLPRGSITAVER